MNGTTTVRDGFERYYTEKLWALVPEVYRHEDGIAANPGVLRRIVELIGADAARSRRSIDRLWEDQHIETCDDWAVPYIADLVGARLVSAHDTRTSRVDAANAIRFRRRRGTPDLLDTLVRAISGWDVVLVEGFRRLARTRHRLDGIPRFEGMYTRTMSGGTADLRNPAGAEIADGPFDEFFHTLDTRRLRGRDGRFGIPKLNFHLYRTRAYAMTDVDPVELVVPAGLDRPRTFTIDPSGRDIPLFIDAEPVDQDSVSALPGQLSRPTCGQPLEWEITQAMRCRVLGHTAYDVSTSHIEELRELPNPPTPADEQALFRVLETRFESERALRRRLQDLGAGILLANPPDWYRRLIDLALVARTGKAHLYPAQVEISSGGTPFARGEISSASLADLECHPDPEGTLARLLIGAEQARFASIPEDDADFDPSVERYHYGFSGDVGAGPYPRDPIPAADVPSRTAANGVVPDGGVLQGDGLRIADNRTYSLAIRSTSPIDNAVLQAAPQRRPYVVFTDGDANLRPAAIETTFLIDGGWYGVNDPANPPAEHAVADFVIEGADGAAPEQYDFDRVEIRFATLDPGGVRADGIRIPATRLVVRARIRRLIIRRSIVGPVIVTREENPDDPSVVDEVLICESIVDAGETSDRLAVSNPFGTVIVESSTILGDVSAAILKASDSIVDGGVRVVNNQAGCFRFSASEPGDGVRLPPRYRDVLEPIAPSTFNSTRLGDPQYAQLSIVAPASIARGAENGSEMGAFSHLITPIRLASVQAKVNEFGPVGLVAQYLFEGEIEAASLVRFGPPQHEPEPTEPPAEPEPGDVIPEPPPPPPPDLPTRCPDEEEGDSDEEDEEEEEEESQPPIEIPIREIAIDAPEFWRGLDWSIEEFPAPGPAPVDGIPFDKIEILLEYDARFGSVPTEQEWRPNLEETVRLFTLDGEGALRYQVASAPAFFTAQAPLRQRLIQAHAYFNVQPDRISNALENSFIGFEQRVEANEGQTPFRGMRADWVRVGRREFHYVTLDAQAIVLTPQAPDPIRGAWHRGSLQIDFRRNRALGSIDGVIDEMPLERFGLSREDLREPVLRAAFGSRRERVAATGLMRNFVVSAPGRFIRAWMRVTPAAADPVLRLAFLANEESIGTARFRVHYGRTRGDLFNQIPPRVVEATLRVGDAGPSRRATVDIPLPGATAAQPLVITLERSSMHPEDTLRIGLRLVGAALIHARQRG
jgi:hypothetical protein